MSFSPASSYLPDPVPLSEVRRVLVTKLRHHGDVLLTSPVFNVLARALPSAEIDALVYRDTAPMLERHPHIAQLHAIDQNWKRLGVVMQLREEWALLRRLSARRYDLLIHLTDHPRGLTLARLLSPRWSVTHGFGKRSAWWRPRYTHLYSQPMTTPRHTVESNLDALRRIGIFPVHADKKVVLVPGCDADEKAQSLLQGYGLAPHGFVHVHPGSRWRFKCWPAERTAALMDRIVDSDLDVVLSGAPNERERALVATILGAVKPATRSRIVDLSEQLTLSELAAVIGQARAFVGVDSAPMHIAAAMDTPTVALFGPSAEMRWGPWGVASRVVTSATHPCRPCNLDGCGGSKVSDCLTTLSVERVYDALRSLLAETVRAPSLVSTPDQDEGVDRGGPADVRQIALVL